MPNNFLNSIGEFVFPSGSARRLSLFRILFGLYLCWRWFSLFPNVRLFFSIEGIVQPALPYPTAGINNFDDFLGWLAGPVSVTQAYVFYSITGIAIVFFTLGLFTRFALATFLLFFVYYYLIFFHTPNCSFNKVALIIGTILLFSPCDRHYSLREWIKGGDITANDNVPLWTQRLITYEIALMYLGSGFFKVLCSYWNGGEVIQTALMGDWTTSLSFKVSQLGLPLGVYDILLLSVIFFELTAPFLLYDSRYQKLYMIGGTTFHFCNAVLLNTWEFMFFPLTYILFPIKKN